MRDRAQAIADLIGTPRRPGRPRKAAPEAGSVDAQLAEARLRRTLADAEKIEQETARRRGELLGASTVEKAWSAVCATCAPQCWQSRAVWQRICRKPTLRILIARSAPL
ncbi:hypothetical protein [Pseudogemmobacter bohemicus]|uniref:hypothetical protein n=1 Tax=Pseudogemmobacter bohemicus TaxID=2250708 RepID=UPI00130027C2|nr:hypothetical protein [Pseudogemmobacter bohemicus]